MGQRTMMVSLLAVLSIAGLTFLAQGQRQISGNIKVDGSSTVYPLTEAVAEEFQRTNPRVRVTVGIS
ncbi:MAG: protein sphX, partial [Armatimonadota bacterium]